MEPHPTSRLIARVAFVLALVGHAVVGIPLLSIGLVAPFYAVAAFWLLWCLMLVALLRVRRTRPLLTPLIPAATAAVVLAVLALGGELLGWTP
jgi:hypothetical protein